MNLGWLDAWCLVGFVTTGLGCSATLLLGSLGLNSGSQAWLGKLGLGFGLGPLFKPELFSPFPISEKKFPKCI